jgi:WD40 repeat protein
MNRLSKNRFWCWYLITILLTLPPAIAFSQGRPPIIWAKGGHSRAVNSVAYSPDGQLLVSGSSDLTIKLWRPDGTFIRSLSAPYDIAAQVFDVRSGAVSPDGKLLAVGVQLLNGVSHNMTGGVQIWRISDGLLVQTLNGYGRSLRCPIRTRRLSSRPTVTTWP